MHQRTRTATTDSVATRRRTAASAVAHDVDAAADRRGNDTLARRLDRFEDGAAVQRETDSAAVGTSATPDAVRDVLASSGRSLPGDLKREMESRMGERFEDVRVHTGPDAAAAADALNARAFTVGHHVAFAHGEFDPDSAAGKHLLAHELAHVRQQTDGAVSLLPDTGGPLQVDPDPGLERAAEDAAAAAMAEEEQTVGRADADIHVQRLPDHERLAEARETAAERSIPAVVESLQERVSSLETAVEDDSWVGRAVTKGGVGGVGGLLGGAIGTAVLPGTGTVAGASVGVEVSKGIAGDVTKAATGRAYDALTDLLGGLRGDIEQLVAKEVRNHFEGPENGGEHPAIEWEN